MLTVEQVVAAQKITLGNVFGASARAFEGFEKLVELNLQAGKAALAEGADSARALLSTKDVSDLVGLQGAAVLPAVEKLTVHARQVIEIVAATNADIGKIAQESAVDAQKVLATSFDFVVNNAPAGTESALAFIKAAVAAANNAYETVQNAVKQATEVAEANVKAATATTTKAARSKRAA